MALAARTSILGIVAAIALASSAALAGEPNSNQGHQNTMQGPSGQLLWLKPSAGQQTCPAGTALAVTVNAAGEHTGKPKCMPKPQSGGETHHH